MKFITAIYFNEDKKRKCIFIENPGTTCIEASAYSKSMETKIPPQAATLIRARTYELGATSHQLN